MDQAIKQALPDTSEPRPAWLWLLAHLLAFAAFYRLTAVVMEGDLAASPMPGVWVGIWLLTGSVAVACCAAAALSGRAVLIRAPRAPVHADDPLGETINHYDEASRPICEKGAAQSCPNQLLKRNEPPRVEVGREVENRQVPIDDANEAQTVNRFCSI